MNQDIELILRLAPILVAVIGVPPLLYNWIMARKGHLRDEFKHAQQFLEDLHSKPDMPQFAKEKGLLALAGNRHVDPKLILHVLDFPSPVRALNDLVRGWRYLELVESSAGNRIDFRPKYRARWRRTWRKVFYSIAYFSLAFMVFSPLLLAAYLNMTTPQLIESMLFSVGCGAPYAYLCMDTVGELYRAEALVTTQHEMGPDDHGGGLPELSLAIA